MEGLIRWQKSAKSTAMFLLALAGLVVMIVFGNSSSSAQEKKPAKEGASTTSGNAENGKKIFNTVGCFECHDHEGQGGAGTGPRLAGDPITFSAFVNQLRHPAIQMPPYTEEVLSDAQVADIYAYLHSIPKPPPASSIPLLQGK